MAWFSRSWETVNPATITRSRAYFHPLWQKKTQAVDKLGLGFKSLAIPYFRMANCHTIIGAKRFHFRVRDGVGWFTLAMVTKQTGVAGRSGALPTERAAGRASVGRVPRVSRPPSWKSVTFLSSSSGLLSPALCCLAFSVRVFRRCQAVVRVVSRLFSTRSNRLGVIWSSLTGN